MHSRPRQLLMLLAAAAWTSCSTPPAPSPPPTRSVQSLSILGTPRSYILRLPPRYDGTTKLPLVILLHGATDSAAYAEQAYRFDQKADAANFLLALPDALGDNHAWHPFAPDTATSPNNDLAFLNTLLDTLPKNYAIDRDRIYICGHSSGAMMTYRMAAERPDILAAAGIVAGTVGSNFEDPPATVGTPRGPIPFILFHGKLDTIVPYDGDQGGAFSVAASIHFWAKVDHLPATPSREAFFAPHVHWEAFDPIPPSAGAPLELYTLDDGNHMWPGAVPMPGKTMLPVQDISATDLLWTFFQSHPRHPH